ncbi:MULTISPECIES: DUF1801 domain-containing protein [unclassified Haladaptatus]|uniref:DUF1801 domain-containing protein n=1 Tax=unclassified Haladaptatus TaxID=2622732 RepID=UPI0023E8D54E|nr:MULTISPECIES: DUF1801 domain-containing protein [unclassified Haladaptatus]
MRESSPPTPELISALVMANRAIRAPHYTSTHDDGVQYTDLDRGLQWGADAIPALLGLFAVEPDTREDESSGWVAFARHWRGATMRLAFDLFSDHDESDPVVVVTAIAGRAGEGSIGDDVGEIELPDEVPTQQEWKDREKRYQTARRKDTADGAASVKAFIAALPGWKGEIAERFDRLIEQEVPEVRRAVRYHQPFYGVTDEGWFAAFSALSKHVKLTFVTEEYLDPVPPSGTGPTRQALDLKESDTLDEEQVSSWIRQAADNPGMNW